MPEMSTITVSADTKKFLNEIRSKTPYKNWEEFLKKVVKIYDLALQSIGCIIVLEDKVVVLKPVQDGDKKIVVVSSTIEEDSIRKGLQNLLKLL